MERAEDMMENLLKEMFVNDGRWNGYPPLHYKTAYHWLESRTGERLPALWDADKGVWQVFGESGARQPATMAPVFIHVAKIAIPEELEKIAAILMKGL